MKNGRDANIYTRVFSLIHVEPSHSPTDLRVDFISPTTAILSWEQVDCKYQNGLITRFELQVKENASKVQTVAVNVASPSRTSYQLKTLTPSTQYEAKVAAVNNKGTSPFSEPIAFAAPNGW